MTSSTPYDHTTPPPTPHANGQRKTPKSYRNDRLLHYLISPRHNPSAVAYMPARPQRHDGRTMARDDMRHDFRDGSPCPGNKDSPSNVQYCRWPRPPKSSNEGDLSMLPQPEQKVQTTRAQDTSPKPKPSLLDDLQDDIPQKLKAPKAPKAVTMATSSASPKPKSATKLKDTWSSFVGWQPRSSDIFNKNFSFSNSARRRAGDNTPPISPRTSIAASPNPTPEEPFKRQRVDSSTPSAPINQSAQPHISPTHNASGYNLGPAPTGPANIWGAEDISNWRPVATRTEAHPGFLVDFSSSQRRKQVDDDDNYHDYLDDVKGQTSSPDESRLFFVFDMDEHKPPTPTQTQTETLNKESRVLGLETNTPTRKRSCTVDAKTTRKPATPSGGSSTSSSSVKTRTSSVASDPNMDRFLIHVKRSQEARAAQALNETVRKWLGSEPL